MNKIKILLMSDIHSDYDAAKSAYHVEKPDFILDCGDHEELKNLFGLTPHFYVCGNHEPLIITNSYNDLPMPNKINCGQIIILKKDNLEVRVNGLDGNYSDPFNIFSVKEEDIRRLKSFSEGSLDIFLTHESPLLIKENSPYKKLADKLIYETDRIKPSFVFSGHFGKYDDSLKTQNNVPNIILDSISRGYCVLNLSEENKFSLKRKISRFR